MLIITRVGRRGQLTIPRAIRRALRLKEGDRVAFVRRGNEVVLQPLGATLLDMRGSVPVSAPQDFDAIRDQVIAERARKRGRDEA
jgi:AbrB family looped-hinge helix DNA binding protein